jgi:YD repeat-containing protein
MKFLLFLMLAYHPLLAQVSATVTEKPVFDGQGRQINYVYSDGAKETYVYDSSGRMIRYVDRMGHVMRYEYASNDSMTVVNPYGSTEVKSKR